MAWDLGGPTGIRHFGSYLDFFAGKVSLFLADGAWVTALSSLLLLQLIAPGNLSLPTEQSTYQFLSSERAPVKGGKSGDGDTKGIYIVVHNKESKTSTGTDP